MVRDHDPSFPKKIAGDAPLWEQTGDLRKVRIFLVGAGGATTEHKIVGSSYGLYPPSGVYGSVVASAGQM